MTEATLDETVLRKWIGNTQSATDTLTVEPARLMQATMDHEASLNSGDCLPPVWHWLYFLTGAPMSKLGRDGHAA